MLPDDSQQPEILESHIHNLAALFVRNRADGILGVHLAHAHFAIPENTAILGFNHSKPHCRWARTTAIQTMNLSNVQGHIFVLTDHGFHPYDYQTGPIPCLSGINSALLPELADYLNTNNLSTLLGLQIIDQNPAQMLELILSQGTVMLDVSNLYQHPAGPRDSREFAKKTGDGAISQAFPRLPNGQTIQYQPRRRDN